MKVKFDILCREKATGSYNTTVDILLEGLISASRDVYHELSVKLFFPEEQSLLSLDAITIFEKHYGKGKKAREMLARVGVLSLKGDQLEFNHRSFAEYFLSGYLYDNLANEQVQKLLIGRILIEWDYKLIRKFFNGQLGKVLEQTEAVKTRIVLTEAVKNSLAKDLAKNVHEEALLHVISSEGLSEICKFLFKNIQDNAELLEKLLTEADEIGLTALHLAVFGGQ